MVQETAEAASKARAERAFAKIPVDIPELIRVLGADYEEAVMDLGKSSSIIINPETHLAVIRINSVMPTRLMRVNAAYELSRWVLGRTRLIEQSTKRRIGNVAVRPIRHDSPMSKDPSSYDPSTGIQVKDILVRASKILLPKRQVLDRLAENSGDVEKTAEEYQVSPDGVRLLML